MTPSPAPRFSIVIPSARTLPTHLLYSLSAQTRGDEVIVVRNQPDRGRDRWTDLSRGNLPWAPLAGVTIIESEPGAAAARNAGWKKATHPWVLFLDDDVLLLPRVLEALRTRIGEHRSGLFTLRVRSRPNPWSKVVTSTISLDRGPVTRASGGKPLALSSTWQYGVGAAMLAHRDVLIDTGGFKDALGAGRAHGGAEDLEFLWHASRHTAIVYLGDITVEHTDVDNRVDIGRKFRHYGRAIARLAGTAKGREGVAAVWGYCTHLICATLRPSRSTDYANGHRLALQAQVLRALVSALRVYVISLLRHPSSGVLCVKCQTK